MADEITINGFYQVANLISQKRTIPTTRFDQTGVGMVANTVAVPNDSDLELELGGLTTPGLAYFENLDDTDSIDIGPDSTGMVPAIELAPGQFAIVFLAAAPYARASANTPKLYYEIFEK